jgi:selenocysteine-specific elongation factor
MHVIGTAGHVDHGKSALVLALTGIDPDRLREEQERQMTIDLGFAWFTLPDGDEVGIVDVPGHRDFIENMLAGVGAIDAAILVVAADEGVMPQTSEHVAILDLLEVSRGVVALTKIDLVEDPSWLELVREDVQRTLADTPLAAAPIVPVSSLTGEGIDELKSALTAVLQDIPPHRDTGRPRLSLDRAFSIAGFGTIVTGTLVDGSFEAGQEIEVLPKGIRGRIRGLQTHKTRVERAEPGRRLAINLSGVEVGELERGDVIAAPGTYAPTRLLDVRFRLLLDADAPLKHDQKVKIFLGAAQRMARVRILGKENLTPGQSGWLQLVLAGPMTADRHDRFILRRPSPASTLGGGQVADPHPRRTHRRNDPHLLERLEALVRGTAADVLAQALVGGPTYLKDAVRRSNLEPEAAESAFRELIESGRVFVLTDGEIVGAVPDVLVVDSGSWVVLVEKLRSSIEKYHTANPLRSGMPREELKSRMGLDSRVFAAVMDRVAGDGYVSGHGARVALPDFSVKLSESQQGKVASLMEAFKADPGSPPSVKQAAAVIGEELLAHLIETGRLVQVSEDVVFEPDLYQAMVARVRERLATGEGLTVAEVRDMFSTSRKYALALMEHLDAKGVTVRKGDERRLA